MVFRWQLDMSAQHQASGIRYLCLIPALLSSLLSAFSPPFMLIFISGWSVGRWMVQGKTPMGHGWGGSVSSFDLCSLYPGRRIFSSPQPSLSLHPHDYPLQRLCPVVSWFLRRLLHCPQSALLMWPALSPRLATSRPNWPTLDRISPPFHFHPVTLCGSAGLWVSLSTCVCMCVCVPQERGGLWAVATCWLPAIHQNLELH